MSEGMARRRQAELEDLNAAADRLANQRLALAASTLQFRYNAAACLDATLLGAVKSNSSVTMGIFESSGTPFPRECALVLAVGPDAVAEIRKLLGDGQRVDINPSPTTEKKSNGDPTGPVRG